MGVIRDSERTKQRVLDSAARVFVERGFAGAKLADIARRSRVSKQLILHHFGNKEDLFQQVLNLKFRAALDISESQPDNPADLIAERFRRRSSHVDYIRFLTWEAADADARNIPAHATRKRRIAEFGSMIRLMQLEGKIPADLDHALLQLAILSLATYPMAFGQITQLVTGRAPADAQFQRDWYAFLQQVGSRLLGASAPVKKTSAARKKKAR
jgi:TetR/AcrR family transcriptional regulator